MRKVELDDWLTDHGWGGATRQTIAGDASARRYNRLKKGTASVILMDADPTVCDSQAPFVALATHLRGLGLAAPEVLGFDADRGFLLLEDLGPTDIAQHLVRHPAEEPQLYRAAMDLLSVLAQASVVPPDLVHMTPQVGADMLDIAFDWAATDPSSDLRAEVKEKVTHLLKQHCPGPSTLSLRDFHAENLIWRPELSGLHRLGLLDFQDAFVAHPMYDVASLLRDARRDVDPALLPVLVPDTSDRQAFHVLALQRNLRIVGVFHRLAEQKGKPGYLSLLPRIWGHIRSDLNSDAARSLKTPIEVAFGRSA